MKTVLEGEGWSNTCHDVNIIVPLYERFKSYKCEFKGDSNEAKIRVADYSTILFQQGQPRFVLNLKQLSNVFTSNRTGIERKSNVNRT